MLVESSIDGFQVLSAITISLLFWGVLRTAIWLLPALLVDHSLVFISATWLGFWTILSVATKYNGGFDLRETPREKWIIVFFLTGVLNGVLLHPTHPIPMAIAALIPFLFIRVCALFRYPVSPVILYPKNIQWLAPAAYALSFSARMLLKNLWV